MRYASLQKTFPDEAKKLHDRLEQEINQRYEALKGMADKPFLEKNDKKRPRRKKDHGDIVIANSPIHRLSESLSK